MLLKTNSIAKPDSQHAKFLPAILKTVDNLKRAKVMETFERLTKGVNITVGLTTGMIMFGNEWNSSKTFIEAMLNPSTPTFELNGTHLVDSAKSCADLKLLLPNERQEEWTNLVNILKNALHERGERGTADIWTPFERALASDAGSGYGPIESNGKINYKLEHVPLSLIQNEMGFEETALGREYMVFGYGTAKYFHATGDDSDRVCFALSTLGEDSKTLWMPMAVAKEKLAHALKRLPIEQAFIECKLEGARLDETMVRESVERKLHIAQTA